MKTSPLAAAALLTLAAVTLAPSTAQAVRVDRDGAVLTLDGEPARLVAYGFYGPIAEHDFDYETYLDVLADDYGVNLVRVWVNYHWANDLTPFEGNRNLGYNLEATNESFYGRLKDFTDYANRKDIVVQVCLFDGVALTGDSGSNRWPYFPYNTAMNRHDYLTSPDQFDDVPSSWWTDVNLRLIDRVYSELSDLPNVIYEVMNEPESHGVDNGTHTFAEAVVDRLRHKLDQGGTGSKLISINTEQPGGNLYNWALASDKVDLLSFHVHDPAGADDYNGLAKPVIISNDGDITQATAEFGGLSQADREARIGQFLTHTFDSGAALGHNHFELLDKGLWGSSWTSLDYEADVGNINHGLLRALSPYNASDSGVYVDLGDVNVGIGVGHPQPSDGDTTGAEIAGRQGRRNNNASADRYFYFQVSDGFAFNGSRPEMEITIDYYDGAGTLQLQYDSSAGSDAGAIYKDGGSVTLFGSGQWLTHTYVISDAYFGNRQNAGSDFRIALVGGDSHYLDTVDVTDPTEAGGCNSRYGMSPAGWDDRGPWGAAVMGLWVLAFGLWRRRL